MYIYIVLKLVVQGKGDNEVILGSFECVVYALKCAIEHIVCDINYMGFNRSKEGTEIYSVGNETHKVSIYQIKI